MEYRINQRTGDRISVIGIGSGYITEAPEKRSVDWQLKQLRTDYIDESLRQSPG